MKRFVALLILVFTLVSLFAFSSCDQGEVDATRSSLMDSANSALEPFFKEAEEGTENSFENEL